MDYRSLGHCGTKVSVFGLGGWTTFGGSVNDPTLVKKMIQTAHEAGVNFYDIADVYSKGEAERMMGEVLREFPRHELVISSKVYFPVSEDINDRGLSRKHIMESIERTLKRIGTDYLDLYFCHRYDPETPLEETARAMDDLIHQGKILYWGTSEWAVTQIQAAWNLAEQKNLYGPQVEQPQYSLVYRRKFEEETVGTLRENGMGAVVWSPLGSGILTGKYDEGIPKDSRLEKIDFLKEEFYTESIRNRVKKMRSIAESLGCSRAQLALAWAAAQEGVSSVITGATRPAQIKENLDAIKISLSQEAKDRLQELFPLSKSL